MIKIAIVMGKQGSGKTTRVCHGIQRQLRLWRLVHRCLLRRGTIHNRPDFYNHIAINRDGRAVFVAGIPHGRTTHRVDDLEEARYILEFPHSGYIPPDCHLHLNTGRIRTRIFAIELAEATWRGIGGIAGLMKSPDYFMDHGPALAPREDCDYRAETARIRDDIARSRVPATYYSNPETLIAPIRNFLLL